MKFHQITVTRCVGKCVRDRCGLLGAFYAISPEGPKEIYDVQNLLLPFALKSVQSCRQLLAIVPVVMKTTSLNLDSDRS